RLQVRHQISAAGSVSSACTRSESVITTAWRASLRGLSLGNVVIASAAMYLACRSTLIASLLFGLVDRAALVACVAFSSSLMPTICVGEEHSYVTESNVRPHPNLANNLFASSCDNLRPTISFGTATYDQVRGLR